jgi:hypothetical protein
VTGIVPDGPSHVQLRYADRTTETVPVTDGVYEFTTDQPASISYTSSQAAEVLVATVNPLG